jgi:hypothetical protein
MKATEDAAATAAAAKVEEAKVLTLAASKARAAVAAAKLFSENNPAPTSASKQRKKKRNNKNKNKITAQKPSVAIVLSMERYTDIIGRTPTYKILDGLQSYSLKDSPKEPTKDATWLHFS